MLLFAGPANRDDPEGFAADGVGAGEQSALDKAESVHPDLAVVASVVHYFANATLQHNGAEGERDAVFGSVRPVLCVVELDVQALEYGISVVNQ